MKPSTNDVKLTKNEVRFSKSVRPVAGDIVEFSPVIILVGTVVVSDVREFFCDYMVEGAKCVVVENLENTVTVDFMDGRAMQNRPSIVSPEFLIKRDLTDKAIEMLDKLKKRLSINQ